MAKKTHRRLTTRMALQASAAPPDRLLGDIRSLIEAAREQTARAVNSALVGLYWHIGKRIRQDMLGEQRAGYGEEVVATLSKQLTAEYGRGYTEKGLRRMIQFAESFPDEQIVATLSRQLGWSHQTPARKLRDSRRRPRRNAHRAIRGSSLRDDAKNRVEGRDRYATSDIVRSDGSHPNSSLPVLVFTLRLRAFAGESLAKRSIGAIVSPLRGLRTRGAGAFSAIPGFTPPGYHLPPRCGRGTALDYSSL